MSIRAAVIKYLPVIACLTYAGHAFAGNGDLYIYPAKGQSVDQQERDRFECYTWASREAGYDPAAESRQPEGDVVRVAVAANPREGAAIAGTIIGAIAGAAIDHHRGGVLVGAGVGTLVGASIEHQGQRQVEADARVKAAQIAESSAESQARMSDYRRAFTACLEGRGYVAR